MEEEEWGGEDTEEEHGEGGGMPIQPVLVDEEIEVYWEGPKRWYPAFL